MSKRTNSPPPEKKAWGWVDQVETLEEIGPKEIRLSYRLSFNPHVFPKTACKKNCRSNPKCYAGLGEKKWLDAKNSSQESEVEHQDITAQSRSETIPVGLINLGNTCYVNSLIQILYNNRRFRQSFLCWNPTEDPNERKNETLLSGDAYNPVGIVGSLQALFALMTFTERRALNPNDFVQKLGVDTLEQQDAQEFCKLLLTLLDSSFAKQSNKQVRNVIREQFMGKLSYVTTCSSCKNESKSTCEFSELNLNIQGRKTISECLSDYLKKEKLDGDNQFACSSCKCKRDATRQVRLHSLPPVLFISLNRIIFDKKTLSRKKVNSSIGFPLTLPMAVDGKPEPIEYKLTAVLLHLGNQAYEGHYVVQLKDEESLQWFNISDDLVTSMQGYESNIGSNDFLAKTQKKNKTQKDLVSQSAVMLVYSSATPVQPSKQRTSLQEYLLEFKEILPDHLSQIIQSDRDSRNQEIQKFIAEKEEADKLKQKMKKFSSLVPIDDDLEDSILVPTLWLKSVLVNPLKTDKIDLTDLNCAHKKVDVEKITEFKVINGEAARMFQEESGLMGGSFHIDDQLCRRCIENTAKRLRHNKSLHDDAKFVQMALKKTELSCDTSELFWIGKSSLRNWRQLAKQELENVILESELILYSSSGDDSQNKNGSSSHPTESFVFNSDIICQHGILKPDAVGCKDRKLIEKEVWKTIKKYFQDCCEVKSTASVCQMCLDVPKSSDSNDCRKRSNSELENSDINSNSCPVSVHFSVFVKKLNEDEEPPSVSEILDDVDPKRPKFSGDDIGPRRSSRRRKDPDSKEFQVKFEMKLRDLKVKIMDKFGIATFDQQLVYNGQSLVETSLTIEDLKIAPNSTIYLKTDPTCEEPAQALVPENGFKGSSLFGAYC